MIEWRSQIDKDIYNNILIPVINDRPTSVFIGAGLSVHAGYPLMEGKDNLIDYLHEVAQEHTQDEIKLNGNWKQNAQICRDNLGDRNYHQALINRFLPTKNRVDTTSIHRDLVKIPFRAFITTNFDACIEIALEKEGESYQESLYYPNFSTQALNERERRVQHIHGYIDPDKPNETVGSTILTSNDFQEAYPQAQLGPIREFLVNLFSDHNVVFLGFGFDKEIFEILQKVKERKGEKQSIASNRQLPPTSFETTHFAILENDVVIKNQNDNIFSIPSNQNINEREKEHLIHVEDANLSSQGVHPIRFNAGGYFKSIEHMIEDIKNKTRTLKPEPMPIGGTE